MAVELYDHQIEALKKMKNGCILAGDTGSGKSRCAIAYYYILVCGGGIKIIKSDGTSIGSFKKFTSPRNLYIITTAKKRDSHEWEEELQPFLLMEGINEDICVDRNVNVTIDSWNNIKKYKDVYKAFFIFDEQRVVGRGSWVKTFLNITRKNKWILLSATPGDTWSDYIPVFVANGFYRNRTEFVREHCVFSRFTKYPKIEKYIDEGILMKHRRDILVKMDFERQTVRHEIPVNCEYDRALYKRVWRDRWDPYDEEPIAETGKLFYLLRKVVNSDESRLDKLLDIFSTHKRLIIFYNFTYEVEAIRKVFRDRGISVGEWNGQVHTSVPTGEKWIYCVQYSAGCEGWNCIATDTIVFYSQNYSYRMTHQAEGRIDRVNTKFKDLYYYKLKSRAPIDLAISRALSNKRNFNEAGFMRRR